MMTLLEEKEPTPSLALIVTFVAVLAAVAFGGVWAMSHATSSTVSNQSAPMTPVAGNT